MNNLAKKTVAITCGDPAGIGPEVTLKAIAKLVQQPSTAAELILCMGFDLACKLLTDLKIPFKHELLTIPKQYQTVPDLTQYSKLQIDSDNKASSCNRNIFLLEDKHLQNLSTTTDEHTSAKISFDSLKLATQIAACSQNSALVTAPLSKFKLSKFIANFSGHTGWLADKFQVSTAMLMHSEICSVSPVTEHIPLSKVAGVLNQQMLMQHCTLLLQQMRKILQIQNPKLCILGLNPHAGEQGSIGTEEQEILLPVVQKLSADGEQVFGPVAADSAFSDKMLTNFDCFVGMYHDQVLTPIKTLDPHGTINITLGLPFIRTSPDHGTAFDIAHKLIANETSMLNAIKFAEMH